MAEVKKFVKDREEEYQVAVRFDKKLASGDSVASIQSVEITRQVKNENQPWKDVASEFGSPAGSLNGNDVELTFGAAADGDQAPTDDTPGSGSYTVYRTRVEVTTVGGETLVATPELVITADGDPDAP